MPPSGTMEIAAEQTQPISNLQQSYFCSIDEIEDAYQCRIKLYVK